MVPGDVIEASAIETHDHHGHDHSHAHVAANRVLAAIALTLAAAAVELFGSFAGHSLFLTADAVHLIAHLGIFLVLLVRPGERHTTREDRTTLAVLAIVGSIALGIGADSVRGLLDRPASLPHAGAMLLALVGLAANLATAWLFRDPARERFSFRAALAHELADASLTIVGLAGAIVLAVTGAWWIDRALSLLIGVWLLGWVGRLLVARFRLGPGAWARRS
jgi:cobalt-zinc-cadmium efflux system protein